MRKAWVILLLAFFVDVSLFAKAQTAGQIAQKTIPSVVLLVMEDSYGQPMSLGSGFFVQREVIATNLHVAESASGGYAKVAGQERKFRIVGHVGIDAQRDLILLKVLGAKVPPLPLGESKRVAVGDEVYVVGNPQGLEGTFSEGIVSGIRQLGSDSLIQITAPVSPGSSGGPVLNTEGEVIGVATATIEGGENLNFATPVSYLISLLARENPLASLSTAGLARPEISVGLSRDSKEAIVAGALHWGLLCGMYSFSLRNQLQEPVRDIYVLAVFNDSSNLPIDFDEVRVHDTIPPKLAKRVRSQVDCSTREIQKAVEFRVLDFQLERTHTFALPSWILDIHKEPIEIPEDSPTQKPP